MQAVAEDRNWTAEEAFDAAEALNVISLEWGLYAVNAALADRLRFRAGMGRDVFDGLEEAGKDFYAQWAPLADTVTDPYSIPEWAEEILIHLENADEAP